MSRKLFSIVALSIVATALVATAIGASTGPVGVVSLIEIDPKDKAQNEKNGDGRAPVILATHSFVEITQVERLRAFQACQKAGKTDCNTDKYRHEWSVPFITVENANKLEKALSVAWNRFDARVAWRINTVINNLGIAPFPHRDYLIPTFSFSANCFTGSLLNPDLMLGAWDGKTPELMKFGEFCDGLSLTNAVSLVGTHIPYPMPCGLGGGAVNWGEVARRYTEAMTHALTKYYPDYWVDVAKAFAAFMPQGLDWGGFGPISSLVPGTEGGSLIAPVYASIPKPVQFINLATKAATLDPLVGYSYIMQKYPYALNPAGTSVLQNKGVLSLANITGETATGISQIEQLKYSLSSREDIFKRLFQWSLTNNAKPTGNDGTGTLREEEAVGYAPFLRVYSKVDAEFSPRLVNLMVSCGQLVFTPFPNLVEKIYPVVVSIGPAGQIPVKFVLPRVHTDWMSVPEGYEIPKVKGVPVFKSLVGVNFSLPSLPTMPTLPTLPEAPKIPTTTSVTETLKKPINLPAGYTVPAGNTITLPSGQVLKPGDILKEAYTLPVGTKWGIDPTKTTTTPATGKTPGTGTKTPGTGGTTTPGTNPPIVLVPTPGGTGTTPGTAKPTTPGTAKPTTPVTSGNGNNNTGAGNNPTTSQGGTTSVDEFGKTASNTPAPSIPSTTVTTSAFPVLSWGDANHCVQMLHALLYGQNRFKATNIDDFLYKGSAYMLDAIEMIEAYRNQFGINDGDPKTTTASVWLHLLNYKTTSDTGVSLAFQIGLVHQGYDIKISGKWDQAGINALTQFAKKHGYPATFNSKLFGLLLEPCGNTIVRDGNSFIPKSPFDGANTNVDPNPSTSAPTVEPPNNTYESGGIQNTPFKLSDYFDPNSLIDGRPYQPDESRLTPPPELNSKSATKRPVTRVTSSVFYPYCLRADMSFKGGNCDPRIEGPPLDPYGKNLYGNYYAVAIPAMKVLSPAKGGCSIPWGSVIKITNPKNGKSVNAWVLDGGPYLPNRNLDMTEPVEKAIGFGETVGPVDVELVYVDPPYDNQKTYCFGNKINTSGDRTSATIKPGPTIGYVKP
jgi:hypothetical protein